MASKYLQKYPVPDGFPETLHDFTREILREQPDDIVNFAVEYFSCLQEGRPYQSKSKYNPPREANDAKARLDYHSAPNKEIKPREGNLIKQAPKEVPKPQQQAPKEVTRVPSGKKVESNPPPQVPPIKPPVAQPQPPAHDENKGNQLAQQISPKSDTYTHPEEKRASHEYMNELNNQLLASKEGSQELDAELPPPPVKRNSRPISGKSGKSQKSAKSEKSANLSHGTSHKEEKEVAKGFMNDLTENVLSRVTSGNAAKPPGVINISNSDEQASQHISPRVGGELQGDQPEPVDGEEGHQGDMIDPGQEEMMEPGEEEMMEPGQEEMMEPGQEEMMEPGQEEMMEPGQEEMMEPGQEGEEGLEGAGEENMGEQGEQVEQA